MVTAKLEVRRAIADVVEHLIILLDDLDGDPDFELEPLEEPHDREYDPAEGPTMRFLIAEAARRKRSLLN